MDAPNGVVSGSGTVRRKQQADMQAQPSVLTAVIEIKRAATGITERYTLIGTPIEQKEQ